MSRTLPLIVQTILYKKKDDDFLVLLLKRTEDRGGFWNTVNGTLEINESAIECRERELREEAGVVGVNSWTAELHRFAFNYKDAVFSVIVFGAEASKGQGIKLNEEHTEYAWVSFPVAGSMLKFDDDKLALKKCHELLLTNS